MSLDVTLYGENKTVECRCPNCSDNHYREESPILFDANITHNLSKMADAAGIYKALWMPEQLGIITAKNLIPIIEKGLNDMKAKPDYYKKFDADNGWGTYEQFVPWIEDYLNACKEYPTATIYVSR